MLAKALAQMEALRALIAELEVGDAGYTGYASEDDEVRGTEAGNAVGSRGVDGGD